MSWTSHHLASSVTTNSGKFVKQSVSGHASSIQQRQQQQISVTPGPSHNGFHHPGGFLRPLGRGHVRRDSIRTTVVPNTVIASSNGAPRGGGVKRSLVKIGRGGSVLEEAKRRRMHIDSTNINININTRMNTSVFRDTPSLVNSHLGNFRIPSQQLLTNLRRPPLLPQPLSHVLPPTISPVGQVVSASSGSAYPVRLGNSANRGSYRGQHRLNTQVTSVMQQQKQLKKRNRFSQRSQNSRSRGGGNRGGRLSVEDNVDILGDPKSMTRATAKRRVELMIQQHQQNLGHRNVFKSSPTNSTLSTPQFQVDITTPHGELNTPSHRESVNMNDASIDSSMAANTNGKSVSVELNGGNRNVHRGGIRGRASSNWNGNYRGGRIGRGGRGGRGNRGGNGYRGGRLGEAVYGNYRNYSTRRLTVTGQLPIRGRDVNRQFPARELYDIEDCRLRLLMPDGYCGKDVLDVGCNDGVFTLAIAKRMEPASITGIDIDGTLIASARANLRALVRQLRADLENVCQHIRNLRSVGNAEGINDPRPLDDTKFPFNVTFRCANYLQMDTHLFEQPDGRPYDIIQAFSVTKWIHLHGGDAGIRSFFQRVFEELRAGGRFIVEVQPWSSYVRLANRSQDPVIRKNYTQIRLKPEEFPALLREIGFVRCDRISGSSDTPGFRRAIYLLDKRSGETPYNAPIHRPSPLHIPLYSPMPQGFCTPPETPSYNVVEDIYERPAIDRRDEHVVEELHPIVRMGVIPAEIPAVAIDELDKLSDFYYHEDDGLGPIDEDELDEAASMPTARSINAEHFCKRDEKYLENDRDDVTRFKISGEDMLETESEFESIEDEPDPADEHFLDMLRQLYKGSHIPPPQQDATADAMSSSTNSDVKEEDEDGLDDRKDMIIVSHLQKNEVGVSGGEERTECSVLKQVHTATPTGLLSVRITRHRESESGTPLGKIRRISQSSADSAPPVAVGTSNAFNESSQLSSVLTHHLSCTISRQRSLSANAVCDSSDRLNKLTSQQLVFHRRHSSDIEIMDNH